MSDRHATAATTLPCPLPPEADDDADVLVEYRKKPGDERLFARARRTLRERGDWRSMAKLLVEQCAAIVGDAERRAKIPELAIQAFELFAERLRDLPAAAHALARALLVQPDNERAYQRLAQLYDELHWTPELANLLNWRMQWARQNQPQLLASLHVAYADLQRVHFHAVAESVKHYEEALRLDPTLASANAQLVELHMRAGAWPRAAELMQAELAQLEALAQRGQADATTTERIGELHVQLSKIDSDLRSDLAGAARHLQAAIKTTPNSLAALEAFGKLYLGSGKATEDGMAKASGIFLKAAMLAREAGDRRKTVDLLRRTLALRPDHYEAAEALADLLAEAAHWTELDDHYRTMLMYLTGPQRLAVLLRRAQNLDQRLARREEARICYEEAGQYQTAEGEAWVALERIYRESEDWHALAGLLEWKVEQLADGVALQSLLDTANVFHHQLDDHERAALFFFKVLEREPFDPDAFEGYKDHFRRKHAWAALRDLILYQIDQAAEAQHQGLPSPLDNPPFSAEFVELAEICERRLGDVDGALDAWHRMSQAYPHDANPREQIARIQKRTRMWDNMVRVQEAELARATDPNKRLEILKRLAQIYRDRQINPQRAIELYLEMAQLAPGDQATLRALTALYDRAGDHHQVIELLRQQYEATRNDAEQVALLRRMAELWHHELGGHAEAMWACEEILTLTGNDLEALHRLQILATEANDLDLLVAALERELKVTGKASGKALILRRLARVAESQLMDADRAGHYWSKLLDLEPDNLEVVDKVIGVYEQSSRLEELAELLGKASASSKTPVIRQLDYLLRLGSLAQSALGDPELARSAFERVSKIRPDHRGALDALASLYRLDDDWEHLADTLGRLRELADNDDEAFAFAWEQAQILLHEVEEPATAAQVLAWVASKLRVGDAEVNRSLLEAYRLAPMRTELIAHAELLLLGTDDPEQRQRLHATIVETWQAMDNKRAALGAASRRLAEFPDDPQGHAQLAELQEEVGDFEAALRSLARKLELVSRDPDEQIHTLRRMAEIADLGLGDQNRALELLRRASGIDPLDGDLRDHLEQFAEAHGTWKELLDIDELRINRLGEMGDITGQLEICTTASSIAETQLGDPDRAFAWARRGYFIARAQQLDFEQGLARLRKLAEAHKLWAALLEVTERELEKQTFADEFELVDRLVDAAETAEHRLGDPKRAVGYLQRALRESPDDDEIARKVQTIAEGHELWDALLWLGEHRLSQADSPLGRFDAFCAIARIHERKLGDPKAAFASLRRAWKELAKQDGGLSEEALDLGIALAEKYSLWRELADHHAALAREKADQLHGPTSDPSLRHEAIDALAEAARIVDEKLADPLAAMRVLLRGLALDREREVVLPKLRELAERIDEQARLDGVHQGVPVGSLVELRALGELIGLAKQDEDKIALLIERAKLREQRLDDGLGALGEWLRVLVVQAGRGATQDAGKARDEAMRLAERYDLWQRYLLLPAWDLERARASDRQAELLTELADLYEHKLSRPEYAFRSRIEAWRRRPSLPPLEGKLEPEHADLWRLAKQIGTYRGPALPRDPALEPAVPMPELHDHQLWAKARLDPQYLAPPGATDSRDGVGVVSRDESGTPDELTAITVQEVSRIELVDDSIVEVSRIEELSRVEEVSRIEELSRVELVEDSVVVEVDELDEIDDLDELDDFDNTSTRSRSLRSEILEVDSAELESATVSGVIGQSASGPKTAPRAKAKPDPSLDPRTERFGSKTIPLPKPPAPPLPVGSGFDLGQGLPELPVLAGPILPPRPKLAGAWDELAEAYAEIPTANKEQKVTVQLASARLWEEGAELVERAFLCHERALLLVPERPESVASLEALADRHRTPAEGELASSAGELLRAKVGTPARLLRAWDYLLGEAALPEHVVAINLRVAGYHEADGELKRAEERFRAVLAVDPSHTTALRELLDIYRRLDRKREYVETYADLLNAERQTLTDPARIERTLELARLYEEGVEGIDRSDESLELLRFLVRDFPERPEVHQRLIELLLRRREWPQAIDAMRTANEELYDPDARADNYRRIAEVYRGELGLPDRAIDAWNEYRALRPEDPRALIQLQELYLDTGRWEKLLPVLDARLAELRSDAPREDRIKLLVAKARALQEGLGDVAGATATLEQLAREVPDDDEVAQGLSRLYRRSDRYAEGVGLLRDRMAGLRERLAGEGEPIRQRLLALGASLATVLTDEGREHGPALELVRETIALLPDPVTPELAPLRRELLELQTKLARTLADVALLVDGLEALGDPDELLEAAALAHRRLQASDRAARLFTQVLAEAKSEPNRASQRWAGRLTKAIEGLVRLRIDAGDLAGATALMDQQLAELEGREIRARLLTEIGRITYRATGDVAAARARFDAALAENPDHAEARLGIGEILADSGALAEAEQQLESAVEALGLIRDQVHLVEGLVLLARVLEASDRNGEAYRRLTTALRHDPDNLAIRLAVVRNRCAAKRWRDALTAVDQLEQRVQTLHDEGRVLGQRDAELAAEMEAVAAECELEIKQPDKSFERLEQALAHDRNNRRALVLLIPWLHERGRLIEAAGHAVHLAEILDDPHAAGAAWVDAGMLFHEAAEDQAEGEEQAGARERELRREAFECVRRGIALVADSPAPVLDEGQLEVAFRASADHDRGLALRCLDRLLLRPHEPERQLDLLLEGVRVALPSKAKPASESSSGEPSPPANEASEPSQSSASETLALALAYAERATELAPLSAAAVVAKARVLEASGRTGELASLVSDFMTRVEASRAEAGSDTEIDQDLAAQIGLLLRLGEIQAESSPSLAASSLDKAARLQGRMRRPELGGFGLEQRKLLASLYERLAANHEITSNAAVLANHRGLLTLDPLYAPSLRALARQLGEAGELQRALALYRVLLLAEPDDADAAAFVAAHPETIEGDPREVDVDAIVGTMPSAAGVPEVLLALWDAGLSLVAELLDKIEFDSGARVSPVGEGPLAKAWRDVLRRMGQSKVALLADPPLDDRELVDDQPALRSFVEPRCQQPPLLIAGPLARASSANDRQLEFALARGLYFTRPETVLIAGLTRRSFADVLSATLGAFHPRHGKRKQARGEPDAVGKLSQELARKLPIRVARQIAALFKDHELDSFDSRALRTWVRRAGDRVGLVVCGDLEAALRVLAGPELERAELRARIGRDAELRELIAYAVSGAYADARRAIGYQVAGDKVSEARIPAPPISLDPQYGSLIEQPAAPVRRRAPRPEPSRPIYAIEPTPVFKAKPGDPSTRPRESTRPVSAAAPLEAREPEPAPRESTLVTPIPAPEPEPPSRESTLVTSLPEPAPAPRETTQVTSIDELEVIDEGDEIEGDEIEPEPELAVTPLAADTTPAPAPEPAKAEPPARESALETLPPTPEPERDEDDLTADFGRADELLDADDVDLELGAELEDAEELVDAEELEIDDDLALDEELDDQEDTGAKPKPTPPPVADDEELDDVDLDVGDADLDEVDLDDVDL
ncbi:tetratricopeptide repeat protein [Nannocystaceae bacterium ST9]